MEGLGIQPVQLAAQVINFGILLFILNKFLYMPVLRGLDNRKKKIEEGLIFAGKAKEDLDKSKDQAGEIVKKAHQEAKEILDQAKKTAGEIESRALIKAKTESVKWLAGEKKNFEDEKIVIKAGLKREAVDLATAMAQKVIGSIITREEQTDVLRQKIKEVSASNLL